MAAKEEQYYKKRVNTAYFTSLISITLVLFTLGFLGLLVIHAKTLSNYIKENIGFEIIMKPGVKEAEILRLQKQLDIQPYIKSTEYVTRQEALERLKKSLGKNFVDFFGKGDNPLLPSIDVRFHAAWANNDSITKIEHQLLRKPTIKEVYYQKSLVQEIDKNLNKISFVLLVLSAVLLVIAVALINNSIRLTIYSKRFVIKSMQLVGATRGFIRRPFVWKGMLQGFYSALIAIVLLTAVLAVARENLPELKAVESPMMTGAVYLFVILTGMAVSGFSTFWAVSRYLDMNKHKLYF
ncbi:permease-like cell division protein FtsX [Candidatus Sulfidibacterium hydrothermale]|uniref:cell division protein FtsX n=1 Tax=Candidatus Sulfidibacterium hydrothermale TaxID=2875962 RepID=UPI001F0A574F|nr:permease-like cell division protein FtsX [Candidatus Sulfidibacterium hydrothermale]UBM62358.1 permease-like cell division protein FtsX [Candidatus Sulfidibacterium hydrothermale]